MIELHQHIDDGAWHLDDSDFMYDLTTDIVVGEDGKTMELAITSTVEDTIMLPENAVNVFGWPRGRYSVWIGETQVEHGRGFANQINVPLTGGKTTVVKMWQDDPVPTMIETAVPQRPAEDLAQALNKASIQKQIDDLRQSLADLEKQLR